MDSPRSMFSTRAHLSQQNLKAKPPPKSINKSQSFSYGNLYLSLRDRSAHNVQQTPQMEHSEGHSITSKPFLNNGLTNFNNFTKTQDRDRDRDREKEKEKDDEGKKRRFSSFINHGSNHPNGSNKRPNADPIRVLLIGRPLSGKSSIISMLLNRDVHPGLNGRNIFVNNKPFIAVPSTPNGPSLDDPTLLPQPSIPSISYTPSLPSSLLSTSITLSPPFSKRSPPIEEVKIDPIDIESPSDKMAISPAGTPDPPANGSFLRASFTSTSSTSSYSSTSSSSSLSSSSSSSHHENAHIRQPFFNAGRRIYQSDKYVITDIDGFHESNTSDIVGAVLEHRKWLEESSQGYNIILMVIKAQEVTDTDRKIFSLCNALLHDMKDMIHVAVTGCDMNPHWIKENETELRRVYGGVKAVGVSFPSAEGGLLECIFEQMRKDSLAVLEEYISKHAATNPRVPVKPPIRGGSVGSGEKKKMARARSRTFSR